MRVSSISNTIIKHEELLTEVHTALFLLELSKCERKSCQVIKQANPLEITNHKTLCEKWDIPSASPASTIKNKKKKIHFASSQRRNSLTDGHPKCYGLSPYIMKNI